MTGAKTEKMMRAHPTAPNTDTMRSFLDMGGRDEAFLA